MYREALIETAFPFPAASAAAAREKTLRAGHPATLHPWASRRPLGLCRAILHAQLTPDPEDKGGRTDALARTASLAAYEADQNAELMKLARRDVAGNGGRRGRPRVVDPFCGSGAIPMQAHALGYDVVAGDINPLAVLLTEAVAGVPARFRLENGPGAAKHGMLVAVKAATEAYAKDAGGTDWIMMDEARVRGRPDLAGLAGQTVAVVARLWVRTVRSPSPAFSDVHVPLLPSFVLSSAPEREVCVRPVVEGRSWRFEVRRERPADEDGKGLRYAKRGLFRCLLSGLPISRDYVRGEIAAGRNGRRLVAIVVDGWDQRHYLAPTAEDEERERLWNDIAVDAMLPIAADNPALIGPEWGFDRWGRLFDPKPFAHLQSLASHLRIPLAAARDEIPVLREWFRDVVDDHRRYAEGGRGPEAAADAAALYCALALSRSADRATTLCTWDSSARSECIHGTFQHHKTNMAWCYAEGDPGGEGTGSFKSAVRNVFPVVERLGADSRAEVKVRLGTPGRQRLPRRGIVATDPPQLAETSHADTTDFHYPFLRSALRDLFPDLFLTMAAPKLEELAVHPDLHGGAEGAKRFVLDGLGKEFRRLAAIQDPDHPATLLYTLTAADAGAADALPPDLAAWLEKLLDAGWDVRALWPLRLDRTAAARPLPQALVVVCRKAEPRTGARPRAELGAAARSLASEARALLPFCGDEAAQRPADARFAAFGRALRALTGAGRILRPDGAEMPCIDCIADVWGCCALQPLPTRH